MKKILALVLCLLLVASVGTFATAEEELDLSTVKLGYVCMNLANPWFVEVKNGFEAACADLGLPAPMIVDSQYDVSKQVSDIETLVNDGYSGIMISPIDQNALTAIVDQANEAGIITSCMAQSQDNTDFGYICQEYEYGTLIGTNAANWINENLADQEEVKVALITQDNVEDTIARADGIQETLEKECPNVNIVARQAGDTAEGGLKIIEGVLAQHPDLSVVVASNDSGGVGGFQAMVNAGFTGDDPVLKGGDTCYRGTVDLSPYQAAYDTAVKMVDMLKAGQKNEEQEVFGFDMLIITAEDVVTGKYVKGNS